jgi:hypothetical protein
MRGTVKPVRAHAMVMAGSPCLFAFVNLVTLFSVGLREERHDKTPGVLHPLFALKLEVRDRTLIVGRP